MKRKDMAKRKEIILSANPNLVVSIHCNKYPDKSRRGAQVFFEPRSDSSIALAKFLQSSVNILNKSYVNREFSSLKGNYYMLKCSPYPSAIVECGFLSNEEDDKLLTTSAYQDEMAESIYTGIYSFLINT
jgi:N-acetylmuramoyl-L-alanine amidase